MNSELNLYVSYVVQLASIIGTFALAVFMDAKTARRSITFFLGVIMLCLSAFATIFLGDITIVRNIVTPQGIQEITLSKQIVFLLAPVIAGGIGMTFICHSILGGINYEKEDSLLSSIAIDLFGLVKLFALTISYIIVSMVSSMSKWVIKFKNMLSKKKI